MTGAKPSPKAPFVFVGKRFGEDVYVNANDVAAVVDSTENGNPVTYIHLRDQQHLTLDGRLAQVTAVVIAANLT